MNTLSVLVIKVYRLFFLLTRLRLPSYILALVYVAVLHVIAILGFALLLEDVGHTTFIVTLIMSRRVYFVLAALVGVNYFFCPSFKSIITDMNRGSNYSLLIIYTAVDIALLAFEYLTLR